MASALLPDSCCGIPRGSVLLKVAPAFSSIPSYAGIGVAPAIVDHDVTALQC